MSRLLVQSLFILVLGGISGLNASLWVDTRTPLLSQTEAVELVLEIEDELNEESGGSGGDSGADLDDESRAPDHQSAFSEVFFGADRAHAAFLCRCASIRQSQVNLCNSFRVPAFFILFHSYQGYLS